MPRSSSPTRVPVEERLFSLVLALLATESGLTKSEILSTVQGYRQRYAVGGDNATLERQFERDKDDIRELGVPLETIEPLGESGNNQATRYRIPKGAYDLPTDISFSRDEMTLLALAATVWREGSLSSESRRAIMKLRSLGVESDEPVLGYAPRLRVREASFAPLNDALERHQIVQFPYVKPGEGASRVRTIAPLALVQHDGRWHVFGEDQTAHAVRTFLLSRIVGPVRITARTFTSDGTDHAARALADLDRLWQSNQAEVEIQPGSDAETRLTFRYGTPYATAATSGRSADAQRADAATSSLSIHFSDLDVLADELAGYGPEVFVRSPANLQNAVRDRLRTTARTHGAGHVIVPAPHATIPAPHVASASRDGIHG